MMHATLPPSPHRFGLRPSLAADLDAARLSDLDREARKVCLQVIPSLYPDQPDDFLTELAGLPEIARVLRGVGA